MENSKVGNFFLYVYVPSLKSDMDFEALAFWVTRDLFLFQIEFEFFILFFRLHLHLLFSKHLISEVAFLPLLEFLLQI
jgi:hypothetical protein